MGIFDGLPIPSGKAYLRDELSRIDEGWTSARFDSLPHVVKLLTSEDREGEVQSLKEQRDGVEEVVDEVVHAYHSGFNKAIQNYSQILRLFSESTESISVLKSDLSEGKKLLGARNSQLHQLWYRSVTLRHIISLLDQIEGVARVPDRIGKLITEKQLYAAVQMHVQSTLMLEREGLQMVGALQDVRSELTKLRGVLFYKVLEDLHDHVYNKGKYSISVSCLEDVEGVTSTGFSSSEQLHDNAEADGYSELLKINGVDEGRDVEVASQRVPAWLLLSTPDEFIEVMRMSDMPVHVKYLQTMVECLCMLGKVAAAGAIICQRLRPTIHEIIVAKIKTLGDKQVASKNVADLTYAPVVTDLDFTEGHARNYNLPRHQNGVLTLLGISPVSPVMAPLGKAQAAAKELLDSVLSTIVSVLENHVVVGEFLESKSSQQLDMNTPKSLPVDVAWNPDTETSQVTGGYSTGFSLSVFQSECQQLICEILRATPETASTEAAVQTARLAGKASLKEKRNGSEDSLPFTFRLASLPNQGIDLIHEGWSKRGPTMLQEGYGSGSVLPEQNIYLAAAVFQPVLQFTDRVASILRRRHPQPGIDGLLAFVENFLKDHFLPTLFVDYRKSVQQAISSPAAFRPRAHASLVYTSLIEKGRPVLQGLLAVDFLAKEVLSWVEAIPKFAADLEKYVQTFLERAYERCRTSYMEAVLEKQCYMLIGRHDVENLIQKDPATAHLQVGENVPSSKEIEEELTDLLFSLQPIKQDNLIRDDSRLILLASLSDSLEYVADSIEKLGKPTGISQNELEEAADRPNFHGKTRRNASRDIAFFANEYRKLAFDCLKILRIEMQLETVFHLQGISCREYLEDQDAEEPDDFIVSLASQITRTDEELAPLVSEVRRHYIFSGICGVAANAFIKALGDMKTINLFGVQQICRNSIALEQALAGVPLIDIDGVQQRLDCVRKYYELLNMPFEALLGFIAENNRLFTATEYSNLVKVNVPGRDLPPDAEDQMLEALSL